MTWFKVDDGLNAHRKVRKIRKSHPDKSRDIAPIGLWALAGSWCGAHSPTGFIPADILNDWDDDAVGLARRLVDAGMWIEATQDGESGYQFHDWHDYTPNSEKASESGRVGNHIRWHQKTGKRDPECEFCQSVIAPESGSESGSESPPDRYTRPDPSRPDPTTTTKNTSQSVRFEDFWKLYPRKIGKEAAAKAWKSSVKKADPQQILTALRTQLPSLQMQRRTDGDFRPHPATWLNQGRWADEVDTPRSTKMPEGW